MNGAVVVVQRSSVEKNLLADLAVEGLGGIELPPIAELLLHVLEDNFVRQAVVAHQVKDVFALECAERAVEGPPGRDLPEELLPEVSQEMDTLVPGLVHAGRELLPAKFTAWKLQLDVDGV